MYVPTGVATSVLLPRDRWVDFIYVGVMLNVVVNNPMFI